MARGRDYVLDNPRFVSRRHALEYMTSSGSGIVWALSSGAAGSAALTGQTEATPAIAQTKPTVPIIMKDKTSPAAVVIAPAKFAGTVMAYRLPLMTDKSIERFRDGS